MGKSESGSERSSLFHGLALARNPWLENYGWRLVTGFTVLFAIILFGLQLAGNQPGQSFLLKSISDILQFLGEFLGLIFALSITIQLFHVRQALYERLIREEERHQPASSLTNLRAEAQTAQRAAFAWFSLSIAIFLYASGQAAWTSFDVRMPSADVPFPGVYDIGFVGSYPFFLLGTLLLTRRNRAALGRVRLVLDALAVIGTALALSWFFVLGPTIAGLPPSLPVGAKILSIYFPTGDLFLVAVGAFLMFSPLSTREMQPVLIRLCLGLFALAVTDSLLGYFSLSPSGFNTGTYQDLLWPLSMMLVGLAAIEFPRSIAREQEQEARLLNPGLARSALTVSGSASQLVAILQTIAPFVLALLTCALLLTVVAPRGGAVLIQADVSALLLIILIVIRQGLTLVENTRLTMQLRGELVVQGRQLQVTRRAADEALEAAQQKAVLEQGIAVLQETHARIARGDLTARAPTDPGPLLSVAMSLNLMLDRLSALASRVAEYDRLQREIQLAREGLEQIAAGLPPWNGQQPPRSPLATGEVFLQINQVYRTQQQIWRSLLTNLEAYNAVFRRMKEAIIETWNRSDDRQQIPLQSVAQALEQLERGHQQVLEQVHRFANPNQVFRPSVTP